MFDFIYRLPLSGDVTQDIESDFFRDNIENKDNQEIEKKIFKKVATYGSQLGTIIDSMAILLNNIRIDSLDKEELEILHKLRTLKCEIDSIKNE